MAIKKDKSKAIQIRGYYTCEQAAEQAGMKPDTVRRYVHRGLIRAGLIGSIYLIAEQEWRRFLKTRRKPGNPNFKRQKSSPKIS